MLATVRDIAIIVLAIETIVFYAVLIALLLFLYSNARKIMRVGQEKAEEFSVLGKGLMESAKGTADTAGETATRVKGSADFLTDTVVSPVIQMAGAVAGARGFVSALFRLSGSSKNGGRR